MKTLSDLLIALPLSRCLGGVCRWIVEIVREFGRILAVFPLLKPPFFVVIGCAFPLMLVVPILFGWHLPLGAELLVISALSILAGPIARGVRKGNWIREPHSARTVRYLPQLLTLLTFPLFFVTSVLYFSALSRRYPAVLPVKDLGDAFLLATDNVLKSHIFFDFVEIYHLSVAPRASSFAGATYIFLTRLLMNVAFIKVALFLFYAARKNVARVPDPNASLLGLKRALENRDHSEQEQQLSGIRSCLDSAADKFLEASADPQRATTARQSLLVLEPFLAARDHKALHELGADPYHQPGYGTNREIRRERAHATRRSQQGLVDLGVVGLWVMVASLAVLVPPLMPQPWSLALAFLGMAAFTWMAFQPRRWIGRLVEWRIVAPFAAPAMPHVLMIWALVMGPFVVFSAINLFVAAEQLGPDLVDAERPLHFLAAAAYIADNLFRTQVFLDWCEVHGWSISGLKSVGLVGCTLTFTIRLIFDLAIISLLLAVCRKRAVQLWYGCRYGWWRSLECDFDAPFLLYEVACNCGPQAAAHTEHYYVEIGEWLRRESNGSEDAAAVHRVRSALAQFGFNP